MLYLTNQSTDPHWNMAFDEFILEQFPLDEPVFYLWQNRPSVIIGFNQNAFAEVNLDYLAQKNIVLARRVTGGGAVYHDLNNLNYTIVGRSRDLDRDYPEYLHFVVNALRQLGVDAEQSGRNDILVDGRKCSGYAKRVWKDRLMVHGTLMFDVDLTRIICRNLLQSRLSSPLFSKFSRRAMVSFPLHRSSWEPFLAKPIPNSVPGNGITAARTGPISLRAGSSPAARSWLLGVLTTDASTACSLAEIFWGTYRPRAFPQRWKAADSIGRPS